MYKKGEYRSIVAGILLLCIFALASCGKKEEPEYGYLPTFVSVPDKVFQKVLYHAVSEEGIYTITDVSRNAAISLYNFETEEKQKLFNCSAQGQAVGLEVGGGDERRMVVMSMLYGKDEEGNEIYSERSNLLQCYTLDGQLCWEYEIEEESNVGSTLNLFMTENGRVIAEMSNYLYVFSPDGQLLGQSEYPDEEGYSYGRSDVFACDEAGEVYLIRNSKYSSGVEESQYKLYSWNEDSCIWEEQRTVDGKCPVQTMGGKGLFFRDDDLVYQYDLSSEEMTPLFSMTENMINAFRVKRLMQTENGWKILCMDNQMGSGAQLATLEWGSLEQTEPLSMAVINAYSYNQQIILFNQRHPEYLLRVRDFSNDDPYDLGLTQLRLSLVGKDTPDLVQLWSMEEYLNYGWKGWLEDLTPYVEKSESISMEDFIPHVREAMTVEGKLYCLPSTFQISTLAVPMRVVGDKSNWTIEEFLDFMEEYPNACFQQRAGELDMSGRKRLVLSTALTRGLEGFVDSGHGKVDLDNERFRSLLTRINELQISENAGMTRQDMERRIGDGEVLLQMTTLSGLAGISQLESEYGEAVALIGYPTAERENGGSRLLILQPLGIVGESRHKDAAWCYLEESFSIEENWDETASTFPARQETLDKLIAEAQKGDSANYSGGFDENGNTGNSFLSKRHTDMIWNAINSAVIDNPVLDKLSSIICEEASYYFSGVKSLDEVIDIMESRAELYFNENK